MRTGGKEQCKAKARLASHAYVILHIGVIWPIAALGHCPNNVLRWIFDVTGFAMHTVLKIYDKPGRRVVFGDDLVNTRRTVSLRRFGVGG